MKISVKVDYACRVMAELARLHGSGELAQIDHLAQTEAVPANFLAQILLKLRDHGLITSRRGNVLRVLPPYGMNSGVVAVGVNPKTGTLRGGSDLRRERYIFGW